MKKKTTKILLITAIFSILLFTLISCSGGKDNGDTSSDAHVHSGGEATCTSLAVCSECGEEYGEIDPSKHTASAEWSKDASSHTKRYTCCNAQAEPASAHSFTDGTCSVCGHVCSHSGGTATCEKKAVCEYCAEEYGELGDHTSTAQYSKDETHHWKDATCSHEGEKVGYALHSYKAVKTEPTCLEQGYTTYTCECGASYVFDYVPANEHAHAKELAYSDSSHWYVATCGHVSEKIDIKSHDFKKTVTAPTCTEQGYTTYACECGYSYKADYTDPIGHSVEEWTQTGSVLSDPSSCKHEISYSGECVNCKTPQQKKEHVEKHSFYWYTLTPATCKAEGVKVMLCTAEECRYHSELSPKQTEKYTDSEAHAWEKTSTSGSAEIHTCSLCGETKTVVSSSAGSATVDGDTFKDADEITVSGITISFDSSVKDKISSGDDLTVGANVLEGLDKDKVISDSSLTAEQIAQLGEKPIYDLTLSNGTNISDLGGTATVRIPYELSDGENPNEIIIWYISDGKITPIKAVYSDGYVEFDTTHFSYYAPSGLTAQQYCSIYGHPAECLKSFAPDCMTEGYTICLHCGQIVSRTPPTGHMWSSTVIKAPTCDLSGITRFECTSCHTKYETVSMALGHSYMLTASVTPTCTENGSLTHTCSRCNDSYTLIYAQLNHKYNHTVKDATCTEPGYTEHTCIACGDTVITGLVEPLGHMLDSAWHKSAAGHYHVCVRCGESGETEAHVPGAPATETSAETCTVCGYIITPPVAHKHQLTKVEAVEPTCTESGNIEYYVCVCGKWYLDAQASSLITDHLSVYLLAKGHTVTSSPSVPPTCTEHGYTSGLYCSVCEQYLRGHVKLDPTGHSYDIKQTAPTCTESGVTVYTCHCGHTYTETGDGPLGHSYTDEITVPTCTEGGYTTHICAVCKYTYKDNEKKALGHDYADEWTATSSEHYIECNRCDEVKSRGAHKPDFKEATEEHGISCTECGYLIQKKLEHVHRPNTHISATAATCTQNGNIEYYICTCKARFADAACTKRIYSLSATVIKALGHSYKTTVTEPTCTKEGFTSYSCERCGDHYNSKPIEPLGHNYKSVVTKPTCTEGGYTTHTCERCDHTYKSDEKAALGHNYKSVVTEPTCTEGGYTTHTCERCKDTYKSDEKEALGHNYKSVVTEPTCTEGGYTTHTCERCKDTYKSDEKAALGHDYSSEVTEPTCTEEGYTSHECSRCDSSYRDAIKLALGHDYPDAWSYDEHEHFILCERCGDTKEAAAHVWDYEEATEEHGVSCTECGYVREGALDHTHKSMTAVAYKAPACTESGNIAYYICSCGMRFHDRACTKPITNASDIVIPALGHSYESETHNPTCTDEGYTLHICAVCGDSYTDSVKDALGHLYGEVWSYDEAEHYKLCIRCKRDKISAAHTWDYEEATEEHGVSCTECGYIREGALEHVHAVAQINRGKDATCTESGILTYYICNCGERFFDRKCTERVESDEALIIPPTGHKEEIVAGVEPTCTSTGLTHGIVCATCGLCIKERQELPMLDHSYVDGKCEHCGAADGNEPDDNVTNRITVTTVDTGNGTSLVTVSIENTNMAGIMFTLRTNAGIISDSITAHEASTYHNDGNGINYILADANNFASDSLTFITFEIIPTDGSTDIELIVSEIYVFGQRGELLVPEYTV